MLSNQKGYTLVYVMMITIVLAVLTVPLLSITGNRSLSDKTAEYQMKADILVKSIADDLNAYLVQYMNSGTTDTPLQYFRSYPGWGTSTITLPEGNVVTYTLSSVPDPQITPSPMPSHYVITITANADPDPGHQGSRKTISYSIVAPPNTGSPGGASGGAINGIKNSLLTIPDSYKPLINQGVTQKDLPNNGAITVNEAPNFIRDFNDLIPTESQSVIVTNLAELNAAIQHAPDRATTAIICKCSPSISLNGADDYRSIYPDKTFVVYFTGGFTVRDWQMNGMLLAEGDVTLSSGNLPLNVDNLITKGTLYPAPSSKPHVVTGLVAAYGYEGGGGSQYPTITFTETSYVYPSPASLWTPAPTRAN